MSSSKIASEWAVENPAIARGRLLTSAKYLATATAMVDRMVGYMDAVDTVTDVEGAPEIGALTHQAITEYLQLGMEETHRELLHAVHALDIAEEPPLPLTPYVQTPALRPLHPATQLSRTATELAREVLGTEVERLRAGGGGWGGGTPEAMRICAAIEVLMDSTIGGKRR